MRILITGGCGFIGSYLVKQLSINHEIISLDHKSYLTVFKEKPKNVKFFKGELSNSKTLNQIFKKKINCVIHLAGILGNVPCTENPSNATHSHIISTEKLCQKSLENGVEHLIFTSSQAVYSTFKERRNPLHEKMIELPDDFYGVLKYGAELIIKKSGLNYTIMRLSNVYGFNQNILQKGGAIENFTKSILSNNDITIFGKGEQKIDYIHIQDVLSCIICIINNKNSKNEIFNVGAGQNYSVIQLAHILLNNGKIFTGSNSKIKKIRAPKNKIWPDRLMSIKKSKKILNWNPQITIEEGLKEIIERRS